MARRAADLVVAMFGDGGIQSVGGHPEIEPALVELYRVTGEQSHLDGGAAYLPDRRDRLAASPRASSSLRSPWFEVSCCPTNVARTLARLAAYVATADDEGIQLHQFALPRLGKPWPVDDADVDPDDGVRATRQAG